MAYPFTTGGSSSVISTELVSSVYDHIDAGFNPVLYPDLRWRDMIPNQCVRTDVSPGAQNHVYRGRDIKGVGAFTNGSVKNLPRVGQTVGQVTVPILAAGATAILTNEDVRQHEYAFQSALAQDLGEVMMVASDRHVEREFFFGHPVTGWEPFLDYSTVTKITADPWSSGTPDDWVASINDAITAQWITTKNIHLMDTVLLPPAKFAMLMKAYVIGAGTAGVAVSALKYLRENNIYTAETKDNPPLNIGTLRYLTGAGVAGVDRAVLLESQARNFVMPFPMAYRLAQPVPISLGIELCAEYKFGSFNLKYQGAMAYIDGI